MHNLPYSTFPYASERKAQMAERRRQFRGFVRGVQRKSTVAVKPLVKMRDALGMAHDKVRPKPSPREARGRPVETVVTI